MLLILNYHRIGNPQETPYDSGTFSCSSEEFEWQVQYLKRHYVLTSLDGALALLNGAPCQTGKVLITFDDGYIDNYQNAFPVLRKHGVQGVFFLPTAFIGTNRLPWWDTIAYVVKHARNTRFRLDYPESQPFDLEAEGVAGCVMRILKSYKQPSMQDHGRFLEGLERACGSCRPEESAERCFLNWDEAREMQSAGMAFGSHTHTHEILSKLSPARQLEELTVSREILEGMLEREIDTLAYPVGAPHTFTADTMDALRQARYRAAFSFYCGFNRTDRIQRYDIRRCGVDGQSRARMRLQMAIGAATGSLWF